MKAHGIGIQQNGFFASIPGNTCNVRVAMVLGRLELKWSAGRLVVHYVTERGVAGYFSSVRRATAAEALLQKIVIDTIHSLNPMTQAKRNRL